MFQTDYQHPFFRNLLERGPWVATIDGNLDTALRFLIIQRRFMRLRAQQAAVDVAGIRSHVDRIRVSVKKIAGINGAVTDIEKGASKVREEASGLRKEIGDALAEIENLVHRAEIAAGNGNVGMKVA